MLTNEELKTLRDKLNSAISRLDDENSKGRNEGLRYALELLDTIEKDGDTYLPNFYRIKIEPCKDCGADDWELDERKVEEIPSGLYDVPPEYRVTEYIYRCRCCGKLITTNQEYDYAEH